MQFGRHYLPNLYGTNAILLSSFDLRTLKILDHIGIAVSNYKTSVDFYKKALAPLGYELVMEVQGFASFGPKNNSGPIAIFDPDGNNLEAVCHCPE